LKINFFWHRRDLRLRDNSGLYHALKERKNVQPVFIFDTDILDKLPDNRDRRVDFIHKTIHNLKAEYLKHGVDLWVFYGKPFQIWERLFSEYTADALYANRDYEPYARYRDHEIELLCKKSGLVFKTFKDHVIFEPDEILKHNGQPYVVFTPYGRQWHKKFNELVPQTFPIEHYTVNLNTNTVDSEIPTLEKMGFNSTDIDSNPPILPNQNLLTNYRETRNIPALQGTSKLSMHFRFGTLSTREAALYALPHSYTWLNELAWRDFYFSVLWHFPHPEKAFKPAYDYINWRQDESDFLLWCEGKTGYPLVDAGMRELNATGFMHNRVRMVVASFLTKHLLLDWRWGEAYFAQKLNDFDLAANNGGWQWASGSGCDAAPYFRIFNPTEQTRKFDPKGEYLKKWIPELNTLEYPQPIVDHATARTRALKTYKEGLAQRI
jgi:deoxyribodipyrimidine photo-lyase